MMVFKMIVTDIVVKLLSMLSIKMKGIIKISYLLAVQEAK